MWTNINKPTGTGYTNVNLAKPSYDEPSITYDSPFTFYDGINQASWTNLTKPNTGSWNNISKPT